MLSFIQTGIRRTESCLRGCCQMLLRAGRDDPLLALESPPLAEIQSHLVWFSGATLPENVPREHAFS